MIDFFKNNQDDLDKCEFFIPNVLDMAREEGYANVKVIRTNAKWYGVTYKEDTDFVKNAIKKMIDDNIYPNNLWK